MTQRSLSSIFALTATFLFSSASVAQTPDYFPLQIGNSWMYRLVDAGADTESVFRTISVEGKETLGETEYFRVRYFARTVYLRSSPDGSVVAFNRQSGTEEPWLSLGAPDGSTFETRMDPCANLGRIESRKAEVATPAGRFVDVVHVRFQLECRDAGIVQQFYAPGTGLTSHEETSIGGPRRYELVYARAGSTNVAGPGVSFTIGLDAPRYPVGGTLGVRLALRSTHPDPLLLHFPSGQSFDFKIFNESSATVYVWSATRLFAAVIRDEQFGPGERTYAFTAPLLNLPPGRYKAQGYVTTSPLMYLGETSFEVVP